MQKSWIYLLTFSAVFLPALWFVLFHENTGRRKRTVPADETSHLPWLFRFCSVPAQFLNAAGLGSLFYRLFPVQCRNMRQKLVYARISLTPEHVYSGRLFLVVLLAVVLGGTAACLVTDEDRMPAVAVAAAIGAFIACFLPGVIIGNRIQERRMKILQALPYSIDLIASAMRGGLDFSAAILFYVRLGVKGPLTEEYSVMLQEMELGVIRTAALQNMADRIQIKEFTSFAAAVVMGTELGASLSETMEIQSEEMRKLRFFIAECKAQRAPSLMLLPMALFILPAVFIIILTPVFLKMREAGVPLF